MIDKKPLVLTVGISWALTLVTILLISNFTPNLIKTSNQQFFPFESVKVVNLQQNEVTKLPEIVPKQYIISSNFSWSPSAPKKNAIFGIVVSFEYKVEPIEQTNQIFHYYLRIHDFQAGSTIFNPNIADEWELVSFQTTSGADNWPTPNQNEYPISLDLGTVGMGQTYIRNVNIMLLVIDG
jgi:hypothetical protein